MIHHRVKVEIEGIEIKMRLSAEAYYSIIQKHEFPDHNKGFVAPRHALGWIEENLVGKITK